MLASTVQFSNNDRPPITPEYRIPSALGPAPKTLDLSRPRPQTPNSVPDPNPSVRPRSTPPEKRSSTGATDRNHPGRVVNVPPMSNHRRTCAGVMASGTTGKHPGDPRSAP
jgi:hypothetical protein